MLWNNSKILTFSQQFKKNMSKKIFTICYAVLMALIIVALVVFMIIHIKAGVVGANAKLLLGAYVLMLIWASFRLYTIVKSLLN